MRESKLKPIAAMAGIFSIMLAMGFIMFGFPYPAVNAILMGGGCILFLWAMHGPMASQYQPKQFQDDDF